MGFTQKPTTSAELFYFDFSAMLGLGEQITSATVSISLIAGSGQTGAPLSTSGSASVSAGQVSQMITGGQPGAIYLLTCNAITTLGQTLSLWGDLQVVAPS